MDWMAIDIPMWMKVTAWIGSAFVVLLIALHLIKLAREALADSDVLVFDYESRILSSANPYAIANIMEREIHMAHATHDYIETFLWDTAGGDATSQSLRLG